MSKNRSLFIIRGTMRITPADFMMFIEAKEIQINEFERNEMAMTVEEKKVLVEAYFRDLLRNPGPLFLNAFAECYFKIHTNRILGQLNFHNLAQVKFQEINYTDILRSSTSIDAYSMIKDFLEHMYLNECGNSHSLTVQGNLKKFENCTKAIASLMLVLSKVRQVHANDLEHITYLLSELSLYFEELKLSLKHETRFIVKDQFLSTCHESQRLLEKYFALEAA